MTGAFCKTFDLHLTKTSLENQFLVFLSPIYITEMFQIKVCSSEDTMTAFRFLKKKHFETQKPNIFKNSLISYLGALIRNTIPVEIRKANTIDAFVMKCLTWMKDL